MYIEQEDRVLGYYASREEAARDYNRFYRLPGVVVVGENDRCQPIYGKRPGIAANDSLIKPSKKYPGKFWVVFGK